jgi:hypothetical protein
LEAVLYAAPGGSFILMPDSTVPGATLTQAHGPFVPCGRIALGDIDTTPLGRRIRADFDRYGHALLAAREADRLFGADALWGFSDRRTAPRRRHPANPAVAWRRLGGGALGTGA